MFKNNENVIRLCVILFTFSLFLSLVSGIDTTKGVNVGTINQGNLVNTIDNNLIGYGQEGKSVDIKFPCTNDGVICDSSYVCNTSVYSPSNNRILNNVIATRNQIDYNITINQNLTSEFNYYKLDLSCTNGLLNGSATYYIEVTADGNPYRNVPIVYIMIGLALIFLILNKYVGNTFRTEVLKIFSGILFIIAGILTIYPGFNYTNWSTLEGLSFGLVLTGLGMILIGKEVEGIF